MKKKIEEFLKQHPKLHYIQKCISGFRSDEFVKFVNGNHERILSIDTYGNHNENRLIYKIYINTETDGFFAILRATLNYLYFSDIAAFVPVVVWGKNIPYAEQAEVNHTSNPFNYYFESVSEIDNEECISSKYVVSNMWGHQSIAEELKGSNNGYDVSEKYLYEMSRIYRKYIRLNSLILSQFSKDVISLNLASKTMGIHVRGTDYKSIYKNHPIVTKCNDYFEKIDPFIQNGTYAEVFLATDDQDVLDEFVEHYGDRVKSYADVERGTDTTSVAFSKSLRSNHHYLLGYEVLRDAYSLSQCKGFIGNLSQVSIGVQIMKLASDMEFEDLWIVDKGIHAKGRQFTTPRES